MAVRLSRDELKLGEAKWFRGVRFSAMEGATDRAKWASGHENLNVGMEVLYSRQCSERLYSARSSGACMSFSRIHWFSEAGYPFQLTRYCFFRL